MFNDNSVRYSNSTHYQSVIREEKLTIMNESKRNKYIIESINIKKTHNLIYYMMKNTIKY